MPSISLIWKVKDRRCAFCGDAENVKTVTFKNSLTSELLKVSLCKNCRNNYKEVKDAGGL